MHVSMYLAYQPVQAELSFFGKSITLSIEGRQHNERLSLTFSHSQIEALVEGLQSALQAACAAKEYEDISVKKLWENTGAVTPNITTVSTDALRISENDKEVPAEQAA